MTFMFLLESSCYYAVHVLVAYGVYRFGHARGVKAGEWLSKERFHKIQHAQSVKR